MHICPFIPNTMVYIIPCLTGRVHLAEFPRMQTSVAKGDERAWMGLRLLDISKSSASNSKNSTPLAQC